MTEMHMHKMFHSRRKPPNDGGALSRSGCFTKKAAEQRRLELLAFFVLKMIPPDQFMACMTAPRPPSIPELINLARERAAATPWTCPHCKKPFTPGESS
jgi:hypothetical protein